MWAEFRRMVERTCLARIDRCGSVENEVTPFGPDPCGVAIVTSEAEGTDRVACIFDKATGKTEPTFAF